MCSLMDWITCVMPAEINWHPSVSSRADLPLKGNRVGDVRMVEDTYDMSYGMATLGCKLVRILGRFAHHCALAATQHLSGKTTYARDAGHQAHRRLSSFFSRLLPVTVQKRCLAGIILGIEPCVCLPTFRFFPGRTHSFACLVRPA